MSMSKLPMLSTATTEEENPDHGECDTDIMQRHPVVHTTHELYYC